MSENLVAALDIRDANHLAVAFGGVDVDDADAATRLHAVLVELGALAVAVLGHGEQGATRFHRFHADDEVVGAQGDSAHTVRRASHRADVSFGETDGHAVASADEALRSCCRSPVRR